MFESLYLGLGWRKVFSFLFFFSFLLFFSLILENLLLDGLDQKRKVFFFEMEEGCFLFFLMFDDLI